MRPLTVLTVVAVLASSGCGSADEAADDSKELRPAASAGQSEVTYQGTTFEVPSRLRVAQPSAYDFQCSTYHEEGVYLAPEGEPLGGASCPAALAYAETIHVQPLVSQGPGDRTVEGTGRHEAWVARTASNQWYEVALPAYEIMFTFYEFDADTREAVLSSIREG